ncbi:alanine racemase [Candidatus Entotheonella palauensis]|nr:alanine racemase [Candidatus Entotheonella palauensis]
MERPIFKPLGTSADELDTPSLAVELDALEHNLSTVHTFFHQTTAKLRPLVSIHCCPTLAHKQLAAGGTVGGVAVMTLGQAEVFAAYGCRDITIANSVVTPAKLRRLCALARQADITVVADHPAQLQRMAEAAQDQAISLRVLVQIYTDARQSGNAPGPQAVALAQAIQQMPSLTFAGISAAPVPMETSTAGADADSIARQQLHRLTEARAALENAGIGVQVVSVGETILYEEAARTNGVTEVMAGVYALLDAHYAPYWPHLKPAAHVLTTVTSRPEPGLAITDAGQKAVGIDLGLPQVTSLSGIETTGLSAEHCRLRLDALAQPAVNTGQKLWLRPWDLGTCTNLYDLMWVVRQGKIETSWPVAARGQYR